MAAGAAPHAAGRRVRICRLPGPVPQPHAERTAQPQPHAAGRAQTANGGGSPNGDPPFCRTGAPCADRARVILQVFLRFLYAVPAAKRPF